MNADDVINEAKSALGGTIRADHESEAARRVIEDLLALAEEQAATIARVRELAGEWTAGGAASNPFPDGVVLDVHTEIIAPLRAALDGEGDQ